MHERGPALVRIALFSLLFGALAMALLQPVQAGTQEVPEIQDPRGDVEAGGEAPACVANPGGPPPAPGPSSCTGAPGFADLVSGWVANETATEIKLWIDSANNANSYGPSSYVFHFTVGATDYTAGMNLAQSLPAGPNGAATPSGVAKTAAFENTLMVMTVAKADIGNPTAGTAMTKLFLTSTVNVVSAPAGVFTDRAPNGDAFGVDYVFGGVAGNATMPGDSDGDGLNDTCETEFFGGLNTTHNGTGDADGDGLTNGQECNSNPRTDPTKADTDGDGTGDRDDPFPTDATKGGTSGSQTSTSTSRTSTSSTGTSGTSTSGSQASTTGSDADGEVKSLGDAVEKLKSDAGYLGTSAGGMVAVLILAILALAVRWSL